jgi:hypothetical protein
VGSKLVVDERGHALLADGRIGHQPLGTACKAIAATVRNTRGSVTSGDGPDAPTCRSMSNAVERFGERKKTHARQTTWKVRNQASHAGRRNPAQRSRAQRSTLSAVPWMPPQITNVQAAPCQRPPSSMVSIRFR